VKVVVNGLQLAVKGPSQLRSPARPLGSVDLVRAGIKSHVAKRVDALSELRCAATDTRHLNTTQAHIPKSPWQREQSRKALFST
jgi:hypothetical protein